MHAVIASEGLVPLDKIVTRFCTAHCLDVGVICENDVESIASNDVESVARSANALIVIL